MSAQTTANLLWDGTVHRGSTWAVDNIANTRRRQSAASAAAETRRRDELARAPRQRPPKYTTSEELLQTMPRVVDRTSIDIQTDLYLEELVAAPSVADSSTQTDPRGGDALPPPLDVPVPRGVDVATQVLHGDADIFDFEAVALEICAAMAGRAVEVAAAEVAAETEAATVARKLYAIQARRRQGAIALRAAEMQERAEFERAQRERAQRAAAEAEEQRRQRAAAAAAAAAAAVAEIEERVFNELVEDNYFRDPVVVELETKVLPELAAAAVREATGARAAEMGLIAVLGAVLGRL